MIRSRRMLPVGHMEWKVELKIHRPTNLWSENQKGRNQFGNIGVYDRITHKNWSQRNRLGGCGLVFFWSGYGPVAGYCGNVDQVPLKAWYLLTSWATISFWRRTLRYGVNGNSMKVHDYFLTGFTSVCKQNSCSCFIIQKYIGTCKHHPFHARNTHTLITISLCCFYSLSGEGGLIHSPSWLMLYFPLALLLMSRRRWIVVSRYEERDCFLFDCKVCIFFDEPRKTMKSYSYCSLPWDLICEPPE
jgi:hypothetical protein